MVSDIILSMFVGLIVSLVIGLLLDHLQIFCLLLPMFSPQHEQVCWRSCID